MSDDLDAIRQVLGGDMESFRVLVLRYQQPVFGFVRDLVRDAQEAEDIAQEVFLAAYTHLRSYDARQGSFATWLFTIARNKCWNALKKRRPEVGRLLPEGADHRTPDVIAAADELFHRLDAALEALPFEQKNAFVLAEIQGLTLEEIARIERVRLGTVKSRLSRAKDKLRTVFRPTVEQP
jgi:RNA polymerase sigma-70 factor (ECF subfamily)